MSVSREEFEELKKQFEEQKKLIEEQKKTIEEQKRSLIDLLSAPRASKKPFIPIKLYSGGLPPYDEEQEKEFLEREEEKERKDITEPRGEFFNPKTDALDTVKLQKHQKAFITKFINSDARGAILFHGTGTGKTLSAVASSWAYLRYNPNSRVFVITPSATLQNFIFGMVQWGLDVRDNRYRFYTYDRYFRNRPKCDDALMIIDEAHNFRTEIKAGQRKKKVDTDEFGDPVFENVPVVINSKGLSIIENCAKLAKKVLLLTATPFVNTLYDIENLVAMVQGIDPMNSSTFAEIATNSSARQDYFRCLISKFSLPVSADFPEKREAIVPVFMDDEFEEAYNKLENSSDRAVRAYYNGVRRLTNSFGDVNNKKVNWIIDLVKRGGKSVVFSVFLDTGIALLKRRLDELKIKYAEITGRQNAVGKEISKNRFNHFVPEDENYAKQVKKIGIDVKDRDAYDVDVLLITKASAEGVDLIGTRNMVLMDGAWNEATIQQIVARAVRYRSHTHLPKEQQFVNIYRMLLVKQSDKKLIERISKSDLPQWKTMFEEILEKEQVRKELLKDPIKRQRIKIKAETLKENTIIRKLAKEKKLSIADVKKLPKKERAEAWKKVEFDKLDVFKKEAELLAGDDGDLSRPSIDLYMLIRSKAKQLVINNFVKALSNVEQIENCVSPKEEEFFKVVNETQERTGKEMTPKEKDDLRLKIFGSELSVFEKRLKKESDETFDDLKKILDATEEKAKKKLERAMVNNLQELFTPPSVVNEMLRRIGILEDVRDGLRVLEPTAGEGAMIRPLVARMAEGKQFYKIDLVEFAKDNRQILGEFENTDFVELMKERNFLKYVPNQKYDYILMNPPFHLRKKNFRDLYKRDVYDIDFVKRAFGMLNEGGKLIAITSQSFMGNKGDIFVDFRKWLKSVNSNIQKTTQGWKGSFSQNEKKRKLMASLSLKNFAFITLVKEKKDLKNDADLINIDWTILKGKPKMIGDQPAELMENNKNQDPISVVSDKQGQIKNTPKPMKEEPQQIEVQQNPSSRKPPPLPKTKPPPIPTKGKTLEEIEEAKLEKMEDLFDEIKRRFNKRELRKAKTRAELLKIGNQDVNELLKKINAINRSVNVKLINSDEDLRRSFIIFNQQRGSFINRLKRNIRDLGRNLPP